MFTLTNATQLASAIRSGRAALNWSQQELAQKARVSLPTIARIESVASNPRLETVVRLIQTLQDAGVDFEWTDPKKDFLMGVLLSGQSPKTETKTTAQLRAARHSPVGTL